MSVSMRDADKRAIRVQAFVVGLVAAGAAACSALDSATDTCVTLGINCGVAGGDGGAGGTDNPPAAPTGPQWACLANQPAPLAPPPTATVNLTSAVVDYAALTPMPGLDVSYCLTMNPECSGAVPKGVPVPDMGPLINVAVPTGTTGFLRQSAPDHIQQDYYLLAPMLRDDASLASATAAFTLVGVTSLAGFVSDVGIPVDTGLGILAVFVVDCDGKRVPDARLRLTELENRPELRTATYWAINARLPVVDVDTDADGIAGFVNMPLSSVEIEATVGGYPFGRTRFRVLGQRITAATIRPWYATGK